jgi:hypothetical protein
VIPLVPWLQYLASHLGELGQSSSYLQWYRDFSRQAHPLTGWLDQLPFQFWSNWLTRASGLGLDYSLHGEVREFLQGSLVLAVHVGLLLLIVIGLLSWLLSALRKPRSFIPFIESRGDQARFALETVFLGYGGLLTVFSFFTQQHYLLIAFPFVAFWVVRLFRAAGRLRRPMLAGVLGLQFLLSALFLNYIHEHQGARGGDFGATYGSQHSAKLEAK